MCEIVSRRAEEYLKAVYETIEEKGYARIKDIAWRLHVKPSTVVEMMKKLHSGGFVVHEKYGSIALTPRGKEIAEAIKKRRATFRKVKFELKPIGIIHTPYKDKSEIPCQGYKSDKVGEVEIFREFEEALKDIEGFSHIYLIYYFHETTGYKPLTKTFLDDQEHGVFATRHYNRPNPIGISIVKLIKREGNILRVGQVDMLDGTLLLDIKPYVPQFDQRTNVKIGWLKGKI